MAKLSFPKQFLWGTATSAYQVEGGNYNNDWYLWEKQSALSPAAKAVDSYNRFEEDFDIIKSLGQNAHRLSLEWSRIQPQADKFNNQEIEHYRKVLSSLKARGIKTIVSLHHFTNPVWFYENGCWLNPESADYFAQYTKKVTEELSGLVDYWITINEPIVYAYNSYIKGIWPPGERSLKKALIVTKNLSRSHCKAYVIIHAICKDAKVSIAKHMRIFKPCPRFNFGQNAIPAFIRNRVFNFNILNSLARKNTLDFIGLNYYANDFTVLSLKSIFGKDCPETHQDLRTNSLGWHIYPEGLLNILLKLKKFNLPIIITENGTAESQDHLYEEYLRKHILFTAKAIEKKVNVTGYLWWSLIDNFEWEKGFKAKFGLVEIDKDLNRKLKPFAYAYKQICARNAIDDD